MWYSTFWWAGSDLKGTAKEFVYESEGITACEGTDLLDFEPRGWETWLVAHAGSEVAAQGNECAEKERARNVSNDKM